MPDWDYGGVYKTLQMDGEILLPNDSIVKVCDWTNELPDFMLRADTIFVDPPWNLGNIKSFYTKADKEYLLMDFLEFTRILFTRIDSISPKHLFIEMGKEYLAQYLIECQSKYKYVTFYNSTYYKTKSSKCYVIHATNDFTRKKYKELEDLDEENIIEWICKNHAFDVIGDLCMGTGLVGKYAYLNRKTFVGTELNKKRLALLIDFIKNNESSQSITIKQG